MEGRTNAERDKHRRWYFIETKNLKYRTACRANESGTRGNKGFPEFIGQPADWPLSRWSDTPSLSPSLPLFHSLSLSLPRCLCLVRFFHVPAKFDSRDILVDVKRKLLDDVASRACRSPSIRSAIRPVATLAPVSCKSAEQ